MVASVRWLICLGFIVTLLFTVGCSNDGGGDGGNMGDILDTDNKGDTENAGGTGTPGDTGNTGGTGGNENPATFINAVVCTPSGDDSTQNNDGSSSISRSHTVGSPLYHSVTTRKDSLGQLITLDYMVHQPMGTPKGVVLLIAGGALTAYIEGTEGNPATRSGGNFLVRSAHRFMQAGYRVITMDRPSDFSNYGNIDSASYLYDSYRTSVDHAIDITTIVNRENIDNLPVFIAGTSRGAISAVAQNMLATGIAISSPVTRSSAGGAPIGSPALPVDVVDVPVHVLYHQDDACGSTLPVNTETLINQFDSIGIDVAGNNLSGGFVNTVANNPCGAFDYHGFLGIENCAVNTTTIWMDDLLASVESQNPGNARPTALEQSVATLGNQAIDINLSASDNDDTNLTYQLPYLRSSLGGSLSLNGNVVHYVSPAASTTTTDTFVYTVIDSKGSTSAAVISINVIVQTQGAFDHTIVADQACVTCHDKILITGRPDTHPDTTDQCETCHTTNVWIPMITPFPHDQTIDACETCHVGNAWASSKSPNHITSTDNCAACHQSGSKPWAPVASNEVDHREVIGTCASCHNSVAAAGKSATHINASDICDACHSASAWTPVTTVDHTQTIGICESCHDSVIAAGKSQNHIPTTNTCNACHLTTSWRTTTTPP